MSQPIDSTKPSRDRPIASTDAFSLEGRVILVTGASSGIGAATAQLCAQLGARLVINGRDQDRLSAVHAALAGKDHTAIAGDLSRAETREALMEASPGYDGLASCAGIAALVPLRMANEAHLEKMLSVNYLAPILLTQRLLYKKRIRNGASLVYVTALSANAAPQAAAGYAASKAALEAASRTLALEQAKLRIRSNCVAPGYVETPMLQGLGALAGMDDKIDLTPLGRLVPADIASSICYLLSDASRWITRTTLTVDGGLGIPMRT
ncbi:SDR family NAD(P)-dependent oxidoreductase [Acidovorax sp. A1169]|uniref:SDR family NAD(P)-dependent oxidoreductase n=1 Tax=Acidovorax sp. A1169 TaxID=3059524 RepID=UPI002737FBBF|nr:SDR family oxidoreductase [Acidovorax sp. A1169]MDP4075704.1 SDR family oxidoreductase [Acidovorax sp. A1169]